MALNFSTGTQGRPANIIAAKFSYSGQTEQKNNDQGAPYLNQTSSYVQGLASINHAMQSSSNFIMCRFTACFEGNANTDTMQMQAFRDNAVGNGGATGHMNNSGGNTSRELGASAVALWNPGNTNSHNFMWGWMCSEPGGQVTINATDEPAYTTQCVFELYEIGNQSLSNGTSGPNGTLA